jgi:hypothetical protein
VLLAVRRSWVVALVRTWTPLISRRQAYLSAKQISFAEM